LKICTLELNIVDGSKISIITMLDLNNGLAMLLILEHPIGFCWGQQNRV
jgi:hypothetical protein